MNNKLTNLFIKHDKSFFTWLNKTHGYKSNDFSKLVYQAQVGIIDDYLYTIHETGVLVDSNKPKLIYYNHDYSILSTYILDKNNDSYLVNKILGIVELVKNKYLPF